MALSSEQIQWLGKLGIRPPAPVGAANPRAGADGGGSPAAHSVAIKDSPANQAATRASPTAPSSGNTPPAGDALPEVIKEGLHGVDADRLQALAEHLPKVLAAIDEARQATAGMQDLAKQQKIDLEKPDEAAAALKGALRGVNVQEERKGLEDAQNEFAGSRNALEKFLTDFRADAEGFRGDLELLRKAKAAKKDRAEKKQEIEQHEHEAGGDLEHAYDATVSVLKSLVDVATAMAHGPLVVFDFVQSGMELPGVDLIKDWIKSDQTTDEKIDLLFDSVEQIAGIQLAMLRDGARVHAQKLADYKKEFVGFYDAYMTAAGIVGRRFQELQKMVDGAARKSGKSGSSDARGLMAVNAAVARNAQAYEKVNALKSVSREFAELPYWYAQLVPLGKLVFDGRDPDPGMLQMMVYQKGGRQTIFHLPPQGLRTSLEDLSKGLQALQKFSEADVARAGRLATRWEQAIINAL